MSIMSPHLVFSPCALLLLMPCCQELDPEFGRVHPDDVVGVEPGSGCYDVVDVSCVSDSECTTPRPVCDGARPIACEDSTLTWCEGNVNAGEVAGIPRSHGTLAIAPSRVARDGGSGLSLLSRDLAMFRSVGSENPAGVSIVSGTTGGQLTFDLQHDVLGRNGRLSRRTGGVSLEQLSPLGSYVMGADEIK